MILQFSQKFLMKKRQLDLTNLVAPRSYIHPHVARHAVLSSVMTCVESSYHLMSFNVDSTPL